ncbi:MAG: translation elongation factor Ts [Elusimicrobia bacterium]|nr:translation elongation factor Ts [Elusimicrobiota bacterium]
MSQLEQIQKLREMTGSGIMDCKTALKKNDFDLDKAIDYLREKGKAEAAKRSDRDAREGIVYSYIHPGSKVGTLLELNCETDFVARTDEFEELAKEISMHIAALDPRWLSEEEVSREDMDREKDIIINQLKEQGKPENIITKIVEGKMNKFYSQNCLLKQPYIRDDKKTIEEIVHEVIAKIGENIQIGRFARFSIS